MKRIAKLIVTMVVLLVLAPIVIVALFMTSVFTGDSLPQTLLKMDRFLRKSRENETNEE